jgi:putative tricarboxylic transport membrane protein
MTDLGLVDGTVRFTNMPGGGVALAHVATQRPKADNLLVAASTGTTIRIAQHQYRDFGTEDVRWLGALGRTMV